MEDKSIRHIKYRVILFIILFTTQLVFFPYLPTFAQETASPSAKIPPLPKTASLEEIETESPLITDAITSLSEAPEAALSTPQKPFPKVILLTKSVFRSSESIPLSIENAAGEEITIELFDTDNEKLEPTIEKQTIAENLFFTITPPVTIKPGKYHLKITDSQGNVSNQEFFWGILAINTNKSIYQPNERAKLQFSVLDETGKMNCDASLRLTIKPPTGESKEYATTDGSIKANPECQTQEYSTGVNFQTTYQTENQEGDYELLLESSLNGKTYTITDNLQVKKELPFIVERVGDTQITPLVRYTMILNISAKEDFKGEISEVVPEDFELGFVDHLPQFTLATRAAQTRPQEPDTLKFDLPFDGIYPLTQGFSTQETDPLMAAKYRRFGLRGHDGIDYSMPANTPIYAIDDGIMALTEKYGDYGTTIVIQHRWGTSYYGHLNQITKRQGQVVKKGEQIGLSGSTGLSTGPHLHFGIKLKNHDLQNGYYGKTNPLPYLTSDHPLLGEVKGIATQSDLLVSDTWREEVGTGVQILTWNVDLKKGDKIQLGYTYHSSAQDQQLYTLEPLELNQLSFFQTSPTVSFREERPWQISVDYTDHGTITVSPENSIPGAKEKQYAFVYTTGESVDGGSGVFTIQIPDGWTPPQTTSLSLPGRTTIDNSSTGVVGDILSSLDSSDNWQASTSCSGFGGLSIDRRNKQEGTSSLKCVNGNEGIAHWFTTIPVSDWTNYTKIGMWVKVSGGTLKAGDLQFSYDNSKDLASPLESVALSGVPAPDVWTWVTGDLSREISRTQVVSYGFRAKTPASLDKKTIWVDYLLIGPGRPDISDKEPWTITVPILSIPATDGRIIVNYGGANGLDGVINPLTTGVHTFLTKAKTTTSPTQTLVTLSKQPTVTLSTSNDNPINTLWVPKDERKPFSY
jgi:murein DD-endopeptidase MepM/ murein hydrolase activator NlpD